MQKINHKIAVGLLGIFLGLSSIVYGADPGDFWKRNGNYRSYHGRDTRDLESRPRSRTFTSRHCKGSNQLETCYFSEFYCSTKTCELGWSCVEPNKGEATCADPDWITTTCTSPYHVKTSVKGGPLNSSWVTPCPVYPIFKTFCVDGQCTNEAPPCTDHDDTKFVSIAPEEGSKGAGSQQLATGDKSDENPNTVTFGGFDLPDKCKGNHLEEMICRNKQGQIAPASIGVDCTLSDKICLHDEKGNGFCGDQDKCPELGGIQSNFPFDQDGDEVNDSCVPSEQDDKCPESPTIDIDFLYDSNGDGKKDSCDLCSDLEGNQQVFPFDTNGDEIKDSCSPVKDDFCANPTKPDGCALYQYNDLWHLGCCLADQPKILLHIICAKDGKWAKSTTTCEGGDAFVCQEGACLDKACSETDLGMDWEHYGEVTADHLNKEEYWAPHETAHDYCAGENGYSSFKIEDVKKATDFSKSTQVETSCDLEDTDKNGSLIKKEAEACEVGSFCVDIDQDGKKIFGCQPLKCDDPDGQDFDSYGMTTLQVVVNGADYLLATYHDTCIEWTAANFKTLEQTKKDTNFGNKGTYRKEYFCNADGTVDVKVDACSSGTYCMEHEKGGQKILSCEPMTCEDTDQGLDWGTFGKVSGMGWSGEPYQYSDSCWDSKTKMEMYCEPYGVGMMQTNKSEKCPDGQICVQPQPTDLPQCVPGEIKPPPPPKCTDPDGGIN